ncbi:MAG: carbonic anhydrase [Candidatus Aquicultor sp.]
MLKEGNARFAEDKLAEKDLGGSKREELVKGQKPFAIILGCSDSRVPPEDVFDQGLGDLFVIRVAGNVDDTISLGSIEYAAEHLNVPLLVVMGHSGCGAVQATVEGGEIPPNIGAIASKIEPSVEIAKSRDKEESAIIEDAVVENVKAVVKDIEANSPIVKELIEKGKFKVVGAKYELATGEVEFLEVD